MDKAFKALADPTRRAILLLLRQQPLSAGALAEHFTLSKPTLSGHFAVLKEAGLVHTTKTGTTILYSLNASLVQEFLLGVMNTLGPQPGPATEEASSGRVLACSCSS